MAYHIRRNCYVTKPGLLKLKKLLAKTSHTAQFLKIELRYWRYNLLFAKVDINAMKVRAQCIIFSFAVENTK